MSAIYTSESGAAKIMARYDEMLRAWPVPAAHLRVPTREGETFVIASGPEDAPPLVLLHGSGANATTWMGDVAEWSRHFRTYAVDIVGEPGRSAPSRPPLASGSTTAWLDDVLAGLGVEQTALAGMSLGGWMALDYATRRPERVTRLALLCPGGLGRQKYGTLLRFLVLRPFGRRGLRRAAAAATGLDLPETGPVLDQVVLTFTAFRPRTERLPIFDAAALARLTMPVLVIVGARDAMFDSAGTARRVRAHMPHATVTTLPDAGHALLGQTAPVLAFLRG